MCRTDEEDLMRVRNLSFALIAISLCGCEQIRDGWLQHTYSDENTPFRNADGTPENFLWVSNQRAHDLMRTEGMVPPATSDPENNTDYEMIDAQLTTEIFGLFAPTRPDVALEMAYLPIRTTAGATWEEARDAIYERYQVNEQDGYDISSRDLYCNGCFASGINFAASIVSLLYGEGDFTETIKIAVLAGWDSDNPAATWGGLLGFMHGRTAIEALFEQPMSNRFNIHRTRANFPNDGIDTFEAMAGKGLQIVDRAVEEELGGQIDTGKQLWLIPAGD